MTSILSKQDEEFLRKCEEELKGRYTENDEDYMKVVNEPSSNAIPPIVTPWVRTDQLNNRGFDRRRPYQHSSRDQGQREDYSHGRRENEYKRTRRENNYGQRSHYNNDRDNYRPYR